MNKRDAVSEIIRYNQGFDPESLRRKFDAMANGTFEFFRATSHLFALDVSIAKGEPSGQIVGDLHAENFGTYRAVSNEIVYDINDFDDTTTGHYEYDLRRLLTSLVVGGEASKLPLSGCVAACEAALEAYVAAIGQFGKSKRRSDLAALQSTAEVKKLLTGAKEKSRVAMLQKLVTRDETSGKFTFKRNVGSFAPLDAGRRKKIEQALPDFLRHCQAPAKADTSRYILEDATFRFAGKGSLGRQRYAILLRKGLADREDFSALRLMEWKEAFDSPLDADRPSKREQSKGRALAIFKAGLEFQVQPKRYWGLTPIAKRPFQAREIGANDERFSPKQYASTGRLVPAAQVFGAITARAHLLSSLGETGPRPLAKAGFQRRLIAFALNYADTVQRDQAAFAKRLEEVRAAFRL
jgi:uncharacterized protein (DUF2252 family)